MIDLLKSNAMDLVMIAVICVLGSLAAILLVGSLIGETSDCARCCNDKVMEASK